MAKRLQFRRLAWLAGLLAVGFVGLTGRLLYLQVIRHEVLSVKAQERTQHEFQLEPRRGDILDARGNLLATSVLVKTICADPSLMRNQQPVVAHALAPLLGMTENELRQSLSTFRLDAEGESVINKFVILQRKVSVETWGKVQAAMTNLTFGVDEKKLPKIEAAFYRDLRLKSVFARNEQLRTYPNQSLAAHVLGVTDSKESKIGNDFITETTGIDGIEKTFDQRLSGVRGWRVTELDHSRRELVTGRDQTVESHDGVNVVLTIDSVIQHIVETALAEAMEKHSPISVSGIVVRPRTGEILAMATLPTFDPNDRGKAPLDALRNRVITDVAEPGSTFKIVVVSGALNDGTVNLNEQFDCEHGHFFYANRHLHDHEPFGILSVEDIITKSSNIGAAKIGIKMGQARLNEYIQRFGFGARTGIPLQGEMPGIVHNLTNWTKVSIAQIPMGQGIAVTRLQMIMAMCAIANNGLLMRPMIVDRLEDRDHNVVAKYAPQRVRQVVTPVAAKLMVTALKTVVEPDGTAPKAALEHFTVAGKTGTAQKPEKGANGKVAYVHNKFFSSFIGFFPADNPELCISVMLDEPDVHKGYYGGQTAAPFFKQIAERVANYLNLRPEDGEATPAPDTLTPPTDSRTINNRIRPLAVKTSNP